MQTISVRQAECLLSLSEAIVRAGGSEGEIRLDAGAYDITVVGYAAGRMHPWYWSNIELHAGLTHAIAVPGE